MIGGVIGAGAAMCVDCLMANAVHIITPATASKLTQLACKAGAMAISGVIGKCIGDCVDDKIAEFTEQVNAEKEKIKNQKQVPAKGEA